MSNGRLLLVLPLKIYIVGDRLFTDTQACNGLRLWLENFPFVTLAGPSEARSRAPDATSPTDTISGFDRLTVVPLRSAYLPHHFFAALPKTVRILSKHIGAADYLSFAIGGLWGDWASVACLIAQRRGLPYSVWTDRVESRVVEFQSISKSGLRKFYSLTTAKMIARYEKYVISRSALGLFHGMDCYEAYSRYSGNPHLVHDIHLGRDAGVSREELNKRLSKSRPPLKLIYTGRAHLDKGVFDWIKVFSIVAEKNVDFCATWFGGGPELHAARERVREIGLASKILFPGPLEHSQSMEQLRASDAFVFCHKTPESPRCLIEALIFGVPIIGYETPYSRDLVRDGGGILTPLNDPHRVAQSIVALQNKSQLATLTQQAAAVGRQYSDEEVFRHRSELIKKIKLPN
jgi:colanic acid/amylovoran biosynthesis glycosyltransferase